VKSPLRFAALPNSLAIATAPSAIALRTLPRPQEKIGLQKVGGSVSVGKRKD